MALILFRYIHNLAPSYLWPSTLLPLSHCLRYLASCPDPSSQHRGEKSVLVAPPPNSGTLFHSATPTLPPLLNPHPNLSVTTFLFSCNHISLMFYSVQSVLFLMCVVSTYRFCLMQLQSVLKWWKGTYKKYYFLLHRYDATIKDKKNCKNILYYGYILCQWLVIPVYVHICNFCVAQLKI